MKTITTSRAVARYARDLARSAIESNATADLTTCRNGPAFIAAARAGIRRGTVNHPSTMRHALRVYQDAATALSTR